MGRTREVALTAKGNCDAQRIELYPGPDLEHAASRSAEAADALARLMPPNARFSVQAPALRDLLNVNWADWWPGSCVVIGTECASGETMRIRFRGRLRAVDFIARHILGSDEFERTSDAGIGQADVLVVDHPVLERLLPRARAAMAVPAWLRQTSALGADWSETLRAFPASLRKETSRLLRREPYEAQIGATERSKQDYYENLYVPYLRRRFGSSALLRSRRAFVREARGGVLLELRAGRELLGGAILRRDVNGGLTIVNSALPVGKARTGQSDLLDYFSFLTAQLLGCRFVDFGVSRPHLDDGVLRYKAKWRSRISPVGGLDKLIRIVPLRASAATLGFLGRNGFIERHGERFVVRRLYADGMSDRAERMRLGSLAARVGVDAVILAPPNALVTSDDSSALPSHVELRQTPPDAEPVAAFLALE